MTFTKFGALAFVLVASPVVALDPSWPDLQYSLYEDRVLSPAGEAIDINVPYRTDDDTRTKIGAHVTAPMNKLLESVTVILDENPMPVSAVFTFDEPQKQFVFEATMRVNGPTPIHIVIEATDGSLYVADDFVKTSGTGACAAPPGTDPEVAAATLGNMTISILDKLPQLSASQKLLSMGRGDKNLDVSISHPSNSGMQMDQISLLFVPMNYVDNVTVDLNGQGYVGVTGGISLSENPKFSLSIPGNTTSVDITMTDTDGNTSQASKQIAGF